MRLLPVLRAGWPTLALDAVLVLAFAGIGRASHHEGSPVVGTLVTALPFLVGMAFGWVLLVASRDRAPVSVRDGIPVWLVTVAAGMFLRAAGGSGTALPFVVVATITLGVFLLGSRAAQALVRRSGSTS